MSGPPLRCPQCGGENVLPSGERLLPCAFCGASLWVDRSGLVSHYRLPRLLGRAAAAQALSRWMAGDDTVKDLDAKAEAVELTAVSFPLWMFRLRSPGGETVVAKPAAATTEPALADLTVPAGRLEPYRLSEEVAPAGDDGGGATAEEVAASVPLETARQWLANAGEVTEIALVHVPLWHATYRFAGRSHAATVEASTGSVFASVFPAKAEAPYLAVAALGLLVFLAEGLLLSDPLLKALVMAASALPLVGVAWWVTSRV
ncbi:MAG TPA: hypothetical protein VM617_08245 [Thermoanaerobaculia bacterium]|nr:hypothetical protein [Thermoanaerobaculia bacterium]